LFWGLLYILSHYLNYQPWYKLQYASIKAQASSPQRNVSRAWKVRKRVFTFSVLEAHMKRYGLINIQDSIPEIFVDLKYSTTDNFTERDLYGNLSKALAHPYVVERLKRARALLKIRRPDLEFIVFDAARPKSIQDSLWVYLKEHPERSKYVSDPDAGSMHNMGLAIDISLADTLGNPIDMGSPYDYFGETAHITNEEMLLKKRLIKSTALENRRLLREIMEISGFSCIKSEWWHFYISPKQLLDPPVIVP
jgi:D-alanyl-D-alanine dipeptidase